MIHNPALAQALAQHRVLELQRSAPARVDRRPRKPRGRVREAVRREMGWLLVDVGLRLAGSHTSRRGYAVGGQR